MRKRLALKSSAIGLISKVITMVLGIICTRVFMDHLGVEIRGINGLLSNCLSLLQLAEMGIGTAIIYALYQPLVDNNIKEIQVLMRMYARIYKYIGIIIFLIGVVMSFFLPVFITETSYSWRYVQIVFYIQLLTSASTYFFAYKRNLLYADQKMYLSTMIDTICIVIATVAKIVVVIVFESYIFYLLIQIFQVFISNIIINIWCNKHYDYLKEKVTDKYDKMPQLINNIRNIMIGRIGGFVYSSTDNLIISRFVGIVEVGYMSNYYQILNILKSLVSSITEPIQPMIGNYIYEYKDKKKSYDLFLSYTFIRYCLANIVTVGMIVMIDPLITIWLGKEYVLGKMIPILMAIDMFISIVHGPTGEFISVLGLFKNDRNMSYIGMIINLVSSVFLVFLYGASGVLVGTVIAQVFYWVARTYIVFTKYFKEGVLYYLLKLIVYIGITTVDVIILSYIQSIICVKYSIPYFLLMSFICIIICFFSVLLCFFKTKEFKWLLDFIHKILVGKD